MIVTINLLYILYFYLAGTLVLSLIFIYVCIKKKHKFKKSDITDFISSCLLSWGGILYILYEFVEEKYKHNYFYGRFKDIFKGLTKAESLYFYFNNKYRYSINPKKKNIIYRIKKGHIICDNYSRNCWDGIRREINLEVFEYYFDYDAERLLLSKYRDFVINRLMKLNKNKVI